MLPNLLVDNGDEELTIDNQFAFSLIGVTDTLEVASVRDLGILDHHLAFATLLHN